VLLERDEKNLFSAMNFWGVPSATPLRTARLGLLFRLREKA